MAFTVTANADGAQTGEKKKSTEPKYTLQQFRVVGDLGAGSFGIVQKVVNEETGDPFAMKVLIRERVVQREMQEQLRREVLTQLRVKHINVVRLHYYFEDEAKIYCLLEYADGGQLFAFLKRQPAGLPESRAARLFSDTASGLAYLHSLRIVHRDLKPENILLFGQALRAKIGDFGWCAELTPEEPQRKTFCGTLEYLAPEMINNSPHDTSLDLWALGVLLYEMLMAKAPFTGDSQKETVENICAVKFEVVRGSMSQGPEELVRGLLVLQGSRRMPLSKVLQHPWLAARPEGEGRSSDDTMLDITRMASQRAKTPPRAAPADMGGLEATRIARRPQAHQGDQGALDLSGLERTVTVPRRQQPAQRAMSARPADGSSDAFGGLEQTRVVPRRPRDGNTAGSPPSPRTVSRPVSLDDTDPQMPGLQAVANPGAPPPRSGGAWSTSQERDSPQRRPDPFDVIRTEYAASCNPRPKERSSRRSSLASSTR